MKIGRITIQNKSVGVDCPVFIIAEAGVNHNGDPNIAKQLVDVAVKAGADAIKFQTFTPELLASAGAPPAAYQTKNIGQTESQLEMLRRLVLSPDAHRDIQAYCREKKIIFLSTPFSESDADFLATLAIPAYKIPSGEITNWPYLEHVAKKRKLLIVSTGMSTLNEVRDAVAVIEATGNQEIVILHSTSNYPPSSPGLNLRAIVTLATEFGLPVGYSDNGTAGYLADVAAVALGACVIEKHFTINKTLPGPDHLASLDPNELCALVTAVRETEIMLGSAEKMCTPEEVQIRLVARKSLVSSRLIPAGSVIVREDLVMKRPGNGLQPRDLFLLVGRKTRRQIASDTLISFDDLL